MQFTFFFCCERKQYKMEQGKYQKVFISKNLAGVKIRQTFFVIQLAMFEKCCYICVQIYYMMIASEGI